MLTNISIESFWYADFKNSLFENPWSKKDHEKFIFNKNILQKIIYIHTLHLLKFENNDWEVPRDNLYCTVQYKSYLKIRSL